MPVPVPVPEQSAGPPVEPKAERLRWTRVCTCTLPMNLTKIRGTFAEHGWAAGLHDVAKKAVSRVVPLRIMKAVELTVDTLDKEFLDLPTGMTGGFLDEAGLRTLATDPKHDLDDDFLRDVLAKGDLCYAIFDGDKLAAYGWYARGPTRISPSLVLHFDPAFAYMYKGLPLPAYRGKRLHAVGMARALVGLERTGAQGIVSYIESNNFASRKSCERLGYRDVGTIYVVGAPGRERAWATGNASRYGLRVHCLPLGNEGRGSGETVRAA